MEWVLIWGGVRSDYRGVTHWEVKLHGAMNDGGPARQGGFTQIAASALLSNKELFGGEALEGELEGRVQDLQRGLNGGGRLK